MIDKIMRSEEVADGDNVLLGTRNDWMKSLSVNFETVTNHNNKELLFRMLNVKIQKMVEKANRTAAANESTENNNATAENKKEKVSKNELKVMATRFIANFKA
jgi:hypothetical protein